MLAFKRPPNNSIFLHKSHMNYHQILSPENSFIGIIQGRSVKFTKVICEQCGQFENKSIRITALVLFCSNTIPMMCRFALKFNSS